MLDKFEHYLPKTGFSEIRAAVVKNNCLSIKNGEVEAINTGSLNVFSIRVLQKGAFGFASTNDFGKIRDTIKRALKLAGISQKANLESELSREEISADRINSGFKINPQDIPLEQKTKELLEINKSMKLEKIVSYDTNYSDANVNWFYLNSKGSRISWDYVASFLSFASYAKEQTIQEARESFGGFLGYELVEKHWENAEKISKRAQALLKAQLVPSGIYDVVIGPKMAGTLAHEAVGHACEADSILTGESCLRGKLGEKIATEYVTICDNPTIEGAFGFYPYDDEGVKARKNILVENGVLKQYMHSRETAHKMKTNSTGNARAQGIDASPIVRMSNTYFEPCDFEFDELIELKKGIYIEGLRGGAVDISTGNYQFGAEQGFLIENGELTKPLRDIVVFGNVLETLKNIDGVDKNFKGFHPGICGKGLQSCRVADGGPNIRIRGVRVGSG
jgi:TldD protein